MPHTIIYKYQKPCFWYFTSVVDGKLKKKSSSNLEVENIKRFFTKKISKTGIIATYIYRKSKAPNKYHNYDVKNGHSGFDQDKIDFENNNTYKMPNTTDNDNYTHVIEYLDSANFGIFILISIDKFLYEKGFSEDGILQKFEDPKGEHNFMIRVSILFMP